MKKLAALIESERFLEECDVEADEIKSVYENKTLIKNIKNCKSFIGVSALFLCITIILIGIMVFLKNKIKKQCFALLKIFLSFCAYNIKGRL